MTIGAVLVLAGVGGCSAAATQRWVVPRLPEPDLPGDPSGFEKPPYADLAGPQLVSVAAVAGASCGVVVAGHPWWQQAALILAAGPLASLVLVDARTTYLPRRLDRLCWALALAGCAAALLGAADPAGLGVRLVGAAAVTALVFLAVWRLSGALGWGDVRLAPLLALGPAMTSWTCWTHYLLLGTLAGAVWGATTQVWRRWRPSPLVQVFPYGPGLWLGSWLALLLG